MKNKSRFILFATSIFSFVVALTLTLVEKNNAENNLRHVYGTDPEYTITLDDTNAASTLTGSYQQLVSDTIYTKGDYSLNLKYALAKSGANAHVVLASHGLIYNEVNNETYNNRVTSLKSIKVDYTSDSNLTVKVSKRNDGKEFGRAQTLTDGSELEFTTNPYYFIIEAGDASATITDIVLTYSCGENAGVNLTDLSGTYTGLGSDSSTYKLTLNGPSATIETLDKPANFTLSGTVALIGGNQARCTFVHNTDNIYYTVDISADHRILSYVSKTDDVGGDAAALVASVDFYKVYNVEDFEDMTNTGEGFTSTRGAGSIFSMTGLRSQFYADYFGTNTVASPVGGEGWSLMGSTDFLTYTSNKGYNGTKAAAFKSNGNKLRYIQMKGVCGLPNFIGKGTYLSFWAKSFSDASLTTPSTVEHAFKAYAFYNQTINTSNVGTRSEKAFTISDNGGWNRYVMEINSSKDYYAFGFYCETASTRYVVVDNVEIYTYDPYAVYVPPVAVSGVTVSPDTLELMVGHTGNLTATVAPNDATNKNVTWESDDESVASVENGVVTAIGPGSATITVTTEDGSFTDTCDVTVTGRPNYPEGTFIGSITAAGNTFQLTIAIGNEDNEMVVIKLSNTTDAGATGITYNKATNGFSISTTGSYASKTFGAVTGTFDYENDRLINIACNGTIKDFVTGNGSITASKPPTYYDCDGTTSELQAQWKRRYNSGGGWQVDNSNSNRFLSDTTHFVSGTGALQRRGYGGGSVAHVLANDLATPVTVGNIAFWVYNSSANDLEIRMWIYKGQNLSNNAETGSVTAKANGWSYCTMGFTTASIYNFQIADFNNSGVALVFDNIIVFPK